MNAGTCEACKALTGELHRVVVGIDDHVQVFDVCQKCAARFKTAVKRWLW